MICKKKKLNFLSFLNNCELFFFALIKSVIWNIRMNWSLVVYTLEYPFFKLIIYLNPRDFFVKTPGKEDRLVVGIFSKKTFIN